MIAANVSTRAPWADAPTDLPDGFGHRLTVSEARRRLFGDAPILRIGRYRVEARVGAGGMGEVYLAVDEELERKVALKRVLPGLINERQQTRLRAEARALAKLSHANVVQVFEIGEHEGRTFLAMQYVEGVTLASWLADTPRGWQDVLARFCAAGRGLAAAHEAGVIHRDFKPDNVLLGRDGSVRVADFGIALASTDEAPSDAGGALVLENPETGMTHYVAGTFRYMSFEQLRGDGVDARSDQFSFCVALYEALWGTQPFALGDAMERIEALEQGRPRPPALAGVPRRVWRILRRGMARRPSERWPDMTSLLDALEAVPRRRRQALAAGIATPVLGGMLVAAALAWPATKHEIVTVPIPPPSSTELATPEVELVHGTGRARPTDGARIWITPDELDFAPSDGVEHRRLTALVDGRLPEVAVQGHLVTSLNEALREGTEPNVHDAITLFVDRRVPWATIVDVLYSTGRAGYVRWDFAVETAGETRVLTAKPPMYSVPETELVEIAMLQLWVGSDHVEVSAQIARPMDNQPGVVRALDAGDHSCELHDDLSGLHELETALCKLSGVAIPVWVGAEDDRTWAEVVEVLSVALIDGVCDGGIVIASDTRPSDCASPTPPEALADLLARSPAGE